MCNRICLVQRCNCRTAYKTKTTRLLFGACMSQIESGTTRCSTKSMLAKSFAEARRVLKAQGHLVVMFGHS